VTAYKSGRSFAELSGDRHRVSANASETEPAKIMRVFVVDKKETELAIYLGTEI
jgi:quercetin dioxygenase-like cupin family protein